MSILGFNQAPNNLELLQTRSLFINES